KKFSTVIQILGWENCCENCVGSSYHLRCFISERLRRRFVRKHFGWRVQRATTTSSTSAIADDAPRCAGQRLCGRQWNGAVHRNRQVLGREFKGSDEFGTVGIVGFERRNGQRRRNGHRCRSGSGHRNGSSWSNAGQRDIKRHQRRRESGKY